MFPLSCTCSHSMPNPPSTSQPRIPLPQWKRRACLTGNGKPWLGRPALAHKGAGYAQPAWLQWAAHVSISKVMFAKHWLNWAGIPNSCGTRPNRPHPMSSQMASAHCETRCHTAQETEAVGIWNQFCTDFVKAKVSLVVSVDISRVHDSSTSPLVQKPFVKSRWPKFSCQTQSQSFPIDLLGLRWKFQCHDYLVGLGFCFVIFHWK